MIRRKEKKKLIFAKKKILNKRAETPGISVVRRSCNIEVTWVVMSEILLASPPANRSLKYLGEWYWMWSNIDIRIWASTFGTHRSGI